jgi:hypothetical protein
MRGLCDFVQRALPWLAFFGCLCLLCVNVQLHRGNDQLEVQLRSLEASSAPSVGLRFGVLRGVGLDGKPVVLDLAHRGSPTLIMVVSPFCQYCARTLPVWREMISGVNPQNAVVADTTGALDQAYLQRSGLASVGTVLHISPPGRGPRRISSGPHDRVA